MAKQSQGTTMVERSGRLSSPAQILRLTKILSLLLWVMVHLSSHRPGYNFQKKISLKQKLVHQFCCKSLFLVSEKNWTLNPECDWWSISWSVYFIQSDSNCEDRQSFWECPFFGNWSCLSFTLAHYSFSNIKGRVQKNRKLLDIYQIRTDNPPPP